METNRVLIDYEKMLRREEMSENTIKSYVGTARRFLSAYEALNRNNILAYKEHLISSYKPATVNNRILALNHFLHYLSYKGGEKEMVYDSTDNGLYRCENRGNHRISGRGCVCRIRGAVCQRL